MSFMETQVLGYQSPLYGRRTAQMKMEPFAYREAAAFVPGYSLDQKAHVYGITGGIPKYLELFEDSRSLKKNIIKNFFTPTGYLYEEPENLLKQELREPVKYNQIIEAVAKGASRLHEIAAKTSLDSGAVSKYISSFISLGIREKETAITEEKNKRKTIYRLADTMFIFWYRYVLGNDFSILNGSVESLYEEELKGDLSRFMGPIFERMCAQYLGICKELPFPIRALGRWWGANPATKTEEEIDLLGINESLSSALFCECKYRNEKTDISVLNALIAKSERWHYHHKYYMLFSKAGYSAGLKNFIALRKDVFLITLEDMYI
jgi:AAA+ ATPase superfamily predicted ATPase